MVNLSRKQTSLQLTQVNTMINGIFATLAGGGVLMVNPSGVILAINSAFEAMTGYSSFELVGKSCRILHCSGCGTPAEGLGGAWCRLFNKGGVRNRRCEIVGKDGRIIHVLKHGTTLRDARGTVTGAIEAIAVVSGAAGGNRDQFRPPKVRSDDRSALSRIVGSSDCIREMLDFVANAALLGAPILIQGESGVGKELVAHALHQLGGGAEQNFVKVNCASLNENLLESELFGHVKGAFTGAHRSRIGRFEAATGGSIFLDEIGDAPPVFQAKLLRVLESREIERVGDHRPVSVPVRVIAATNKNLKELVEHKLFREDLYYRINVVPVFVPPLRDRREDIPLLAQTFIDRTAVRTGRTIRALSPEALNILTAYDWPGNIRELRNAIEHSFVLCREAVILPKHLPSQFSGFGSGHEPRLAVKTARSPKGRVEAPDERDALLRALEQAAGSRTEAARILGVSRVTVWKRMRKFGIVQDRARP
jgi:two-component system response regulator HydG